MQASASRYVRSMARESAVLAVAALGAYLFFIHGSLYLQAGTTGRPFSLEGYLLVTSILYLFLRLIFLVASLYYPRPRPDFILCPECGRALDDASPEGIERHHRIALAPKPTEKEVLAAVMLRKAIDDARRSSRHDLRGPRAREVDVPGDVENLPMPVEELERILRDLDGVRSPRGPADRRPRGPPRGPS